MRKTKNLSRVLSMVLAFCLSVALLPAQAFAATKDDDPSTWPAPDSIYTAPEKNPVYLMVDFTDEDNRCKDDPHNRYPLVEWGITEAQALQICYDRGYDFGGLYEIYRRASCWCCPLQRIDELRKLRTHHPELWARLREMDNRAREMFGPGPLGQFKQNWSVERLEERFAQEDTATGSNTKK